MQKNCASSCCADKISKHLMDGMWRRHQQQLIPDVHLVILSTHCRRWLLKNGFCCVRPSVQWWTSVMLLQIHMYTQRSDDMAGRFPIRHIEQICRFDGHSHKMKVVFPFFAITRNPKIFIETVVTWHVTKRRNRSCVCTYLYIADKLTGNAKTVGAESSSKTIITFS